LVFKEDLMKVTCRDKMKVSRVAGVLGELRMSAKSDRIGVSGGTSATSVNTPEAARVQFAAPLAMY
jgi:hypothetical protein